MRPETREDRGDDHWEAAHICRCYPLDLREGASEYYGGICERGHFLRCRIVAPSLVNRFGESSQVHGVAAMGGRDGGCERVCRCKTIWSARGFSGYMGSFFQCCKGRGMGLGGT